MERTEDFHRHDRLIARITMRRYRAFMALNANSVQIARALTKMFGGRVDWTGSTKRELAERFAVAGHTGYGNISMEMFNSLIRQFGAREQIPIVDFSEAL